jgi:hypothetical protein
MQTLVDTLVHVFEHWKTSLGGSALGATAFHLLQAGCGAPTWQKWGVAIAIAALGLIAKDPGK